MDMYSKNQYLKRLRERYLETRSKKEKGKILDEYCKNTGQNRKYVIRKIQPRTPLVPRPRKKRKVVYGGYVKAALAKVWEIFDYPCGQRLEPILTPEMVERLRKLKELSCPDEVEEKLTKISARSIDEKLRHQKEVLRQLQRKGKARSPSLLLKKIPVKVHGELDNSKLGNIEIDFVEHCGNSAAGEFICTIDTIDIASGWQEWEAIIGRGQIPTQKGLEKERSRYPFPWIEIHPDNDSGFVNAHLYKYSQETNLLFSRSRPYKKNDNCYVEQRNWFSVRKKFGYLRFDTQEEKDILNDLYQNELRLYKNFFQPIMRLKEKIREGGRVHRKYYPAKTPYQYLMESDQIPEERKRELSEIYLSLNPAELKRAIEFKLDRLCQIYKQKKNNFQVVQPLKKQKPLLVTKYIAEQELIRLPT